MKQCFNCKETKSLSEFYFCHSRPKGTSWCKTCKNKYDIKRWIEKKRKAIEYKGGCCHNCGYNKYYGALQFHHINPDEKDYDWSKLRLRSWSSITHELDKCILLCANCHFEIHAHFR